MHKILVLSVLSVLSSSLWGSSIPSKDEKKDEFRALCEALIDTAKCTEYCKRWSEQDYPYNIDTESHPFLLGKKVADSITMEIESGDRKLALAIAALVQKSRTDKSSVFKSLFIRLMLPGREDDTLFDDLTIWFEQHPENVDTLYVQEQRTIGDILDLILQHTKGWEIGLKVAALVQAHRTKKNAVFKALCRAFEKDSGNADIVRGLNTWVRDHPISIDSGISGEAPDLDPAGPIAGARENKRETMQGNQGKPDNVSKSNDQRAQWLLLRTVGIAFILTAGFFYFWRSTSKKSAEESERKSFIDESA